MKQNESIGMYDAAVINTYIETFADVCCQISILSSARKESTTVYVADFPPL